MKKNYTSLFLTLTFTVLFNFFAEAQLVASNDYAYIDYQTTPIMVIANVLQNDLLNGNEVTLGMVSLQQIGISPVVLSLENNGSVYFSTAGIGSTGVFTLPYRICELANPANCSIGYITVNVGGCESPTPTFTDIVQPACNTPGSFFMNIQPPGTGCTVTVLKDGLPYSSFSGDLQLTVPFVGMPPGEYALLLQDGSGCGSLPAELILEDNCLQLEYVATYLDYNTDGFINVGDIIDYQFTVTNNNTVTITGVTVSGSNSALVTVSGNPIPTLAAGASDSTTFTGMRIINQSDISGGYVSDDILAFATIDFTLIQDIDTANTILGLTDGIRLNAFIDSNSNGTQEVGEQNFTHGSLQYEINNDGTVHNILSGGPYELFETNPSNSYRLDLIIDGGFTAQYSTTATYDNVTVALGSGITTYNFPVAELPYSNTAVYLYQIGAPPRPGFTFVNRIHYKNNGNQLIANGDIIFNRDAAISIVGSLPNPTSIFAGGYVFSFTNLQPNESRYIDITMQVPVIPIVNLGDQITNCVSIPTFGEDIHPADNFNCITQTIVGSYDPNQKVEHHGGQIVHSQFTSDDYLTYTIQFENTGTANAVNVNVNDILDSKLDETTVRMITASHSYVLDRVDNNLNWRFNAIDLPPSVADTEIGHGYIVFEVKPKPGYAVGDIIPNSADIYFDFNPAIVTNICNTEFVATLAVNQFDRDEFSCYPNPTQGILNISSINNAVIDQVIVNDIMGKTVFIKHANSVEVSVDISKLSNGIFFVKVMSGGIGKTIKVLKE